MFESHMIGKQLATKYSFKLCLYDHKLIFVFNLQYMKFQNFVPVNLIVCCDNLLSKADTWILLACLVLWVCIVLFCMYISLNIEGNNPFWCFSINIST